MTTLATRSEKLSNVLAWESHADHGYCRSTVTVTVETGMDVGAVVVRSLTSPTATPVTTGTGNGSIGTITVADTAATGVYTLKIIEAAANAGNFVVLNPEGVSVGNGTVAVAFSGGGLSFTLADGSTDFVVGDSIAITVAGTVKYKWVEAADVATLGDDVRVVIDAHTNIKTAADHSLTVLGSETLFSPAIVNKAGLKFKDSLSAGQINTVVAKLNARGIRTAVRV